MKLKWIPSPNWDGREHGLVDAVVLHYTALPLDETIARFADKGAEVSAHFIIDRDGTVVQMVRTEHRAWHAGASRMEGRDDVNDFSVGVELVNWGQLRKRGDRFYVWKNDWSLLYLGETPVETRNGYWEPYTEEQYAALVELLTEIRSDYPALTRERVRGHSEVCLPRQRKEDPGGAFDWERVLGAVFG